MAYARVTAADASGIGAAGTVTVNFGHTTTVGNLLIAIVQSSAAPGAHTMTGWTLAKDQGYSTSGTSASLSVFYKISTGDTAATSTATGGGAMQLLLYEYSGNAPSSLIDGTPGANNNGSTNVTSLAVAATGVTTTDAGDLLIAVSAQNNTNGGSQAFTSATLLPVGSATKVFAGQRLPGATGTYNDTGSWSTARAAAGIIVAFKAPATINVSGATATETDTPHAGNPSSSSTVYGVQATETDTPHAGAPNVINGHQVVETDTPHAGTHVVGDWSVRRIPASDAVGIHGVGTVTVNFGQIPTAGNLLIAIVTSGAAGPGINSMSPAGWTLIRDVGFGTGGVAAAASVFYKIAAGTPGTPSSDTGATCNAPSGGSVEMILYEYQGAGNPAVIDISSTASTLVNTAVLNSTAITTTDPGDLILLTAHTVTGNGGGQTWSTADLIPVSSASKTFAGEYKPNAVVSNFGDVAQWVTAKPAAVFAIAIKREPPVAVTGALGSETESPHAGSIFGTFNFLGQAVTETDTARPGGVSTPTQAAGQRAVETDTPHAGGPSIRVQGFGTVILDSDGQPILDGDGAQIRSEPQERDTAGVGSTSGGSPNFGGSTAVEVDTAYAGVAAFTVPGATAAETDSAHAGTAAGINAIVGTTATEVDSAHEGAVTVGVVGWLVGAIPI